MTSATALIDTTFTGKNISTAVSVYEWTANITARVWFQVRLAAVAGGGDYVAYLTLNDGDGQTDDVIGPKTTYTAGAGETAFWLQTGSIAVISGDVVNVFVDGLAGDTNEAGSIRIFVDNGADATDWTPARAIKVDNLDAAITTRLAAVGYAAPPSVVDITAGILAGAVEGTLTLVQAQRLMLAVLTGKSSGGGTTTVTFRDTADSKDRVVATVDVSGNRSAVVRTVT